MSLKYAILGLLSYKPQTGYDLKAHFDQTIRHIWKADQAQIYRTLSDITKKGLAISETVIQEGKPNKKVYQLTEEGKAELIEWLSTPVQSRDQRNAELIQVFFSGATDNETILDNLKKLRAGTLEKIEALTTLERKSDLFAQSRMSSRDHFFFHATLDLGIRSAQMNLEWLDGLIESIDTGDLPRG